MARYLMLVEILLKFDCLFLSLIENLIDLT